MAPQLRSSAREEPRLFADRPLSETDRLWFSVDGLRDVTPQLSADHTLSFGQRRGLLVFLVVVGVALPLLWKQTLVVILGALTILYFASMVLRIRLFRLALNGRGLIQISDEAALAVPDEQLPSYSVLVPAFKEPEVCKHLIENLRRLDYPRDRLEIFLLLEADDSETIEAARTTIGALDDVQILLIPQRPPQTKPKALNYGLTHAHGEIVAIYDAEDRPDPLQLRKAAMALRGTPPEVVCVQAQLAFFNPTQNLITRWFTIEYGMWFSQLLPGLAQLDAPIPLGGTSNHFQRATLMEVRAWDPYNVTEDADLGIRLHRAGYRSGVIDSVTFEEANSDFINWIKQRSRWYKGYAQTFLVHLRQPRTLLKELGLREFILFGLFIGGTPLLALLNPFFWSMAALWWIAHPHIISELIPTAIYFIGLTAWAIGNFIFAYTCMLSVRDKQEGLWWAAILMPLYWVMMSMAALKAGIQLISAPSYWEKTQHGLDTPEMRADPTAAFTE